MTVIIALTGGIASGKSLASNYMEKAGFKIIDADIIARQVVAKGSEALSILVNSFGSRILTSEGILDRPTLKQIVFDDPLKLHLLNQITHPRIEHEIKKQMENINYGVVVLVIPLLNIHMFETYKVNRVLVVDVRSDVQLQRVMTRDGIGLKMAEKVMASQSNRKDRLSMADDIMVNNGSVMQFQLKIAQIIKFYRQMIYV